MENEDYEPFEDSRECFDSGGMDSGEEEDLDRQFRHDGSDTRR